MNILNGAELNPHRFLRFATKQWTKEAKSDIITRYIL